MPANDAAPVIASPLVQPKLALVPARESGISLQALGIRHRQVSEIIRFGSTNRGRAPWALLLRLTGSHRQVSANSLGRRRADCTFSSILLEGHFPFRCLGVVHTRIHDPTHTIMPTVYRSVIAVGSTTRTWLEYVPTCCRRLTFNLHA